MTTTRRPSVEDRVIDPFEAAARAYFDRGQVGRSDGSRLRPDGQRWQWDDLTEDDRRAYRAIVEPPVQIALRTAAEHMPITVSRGDVISVMPACAMKRCPGAQHGGEDLVVAAVANAFRDGLHRLALGLDPRGFDEEA